MNQDLIITFLSTSIIITLMPGPDNTYVILESVTRGIKRGITFASGLVTGIIFHTILVATGIAYIISHSSIAYISLKYFGGAYLFYLAYLAYKESNLHVKLILNKSNYSRLYLKGLLMNITNPKVLLFFIAYLPQFVTKNGWNFRYQIFILGLLFFIQAFIIMSTLAILSGKLKIYVKNPKFWYYVKYVKIIVLIILAAFIII